MRRTRARDHGRGGATSLAESVKNQAIKKKKPGERRKGTGTERLRSWPKLYEKEDSGGRRRHKKREGANFGVKKPRKENQNEEMFRSICPCV